MIKAEGYMYLTAFSVTSGKIIDLHVNFMIKGMKNTLTGTQGELVIL